ncbi:exodeoxyribonuclease V, gamma subunit [Flexistipes sinusarabici DSM 4947]|uniref:RecBCD enzyme subunit RecC n=1 Tax=Flexistipes sinusarabici (strain ATCC 49648 / DSM 4947 / MAS 10) TaxID=717231 RepID=F8E602_FLESM|nr:exodeoxyribonuclease V subunit gamma [Flexistipes sinusarabici]AEI15843.1 exodeoxyribonuclease V, gamma subunit [Flexistipes sinusarabici DSM 4947]
MSLNVYYGVQLENVFDLFAYSLEKNRSVDPLESEFVVVQTEGMKKWLSLMLAQRFSVCSNIKFFTPNGIINHLAGRITGEQIKADKKKLAWVIYSTLPLHFENRYFDEIKRYTAFDRSGVKQYQLSEKIADIFDQYQVYRPWMLQSWEKGEYVNQNGEKLPEDYWWQPILWQNLCKRDEINRSDVYLRMLNTTGAAGAKDENKHIFVFGISVLPPLYVKILENLGYRFEIEMFLQSPSREYFGTERFYKNADREELKEGVNSLVANLARTGSEFFDFLAEYIDYFSSDMKPKKEESLLQCVQNDIISLKPPGKIIDTHKTEDESIIVNSCHSPMREVQVLYDYLLRFFDEDSNLTPSDIVVMTPDIEEYAPYINAVFGSAAFDDVSIPYSISDKTLSGIYSSVQLFTSFLQISSGRLKFSDIFQFLEKEIVYTKFGLTPPDVEMLKSLCKSSVMKWGWDSDIAESFNLPYYEYFTVSKGIDRLLLGSAVLAYEWSSFDDIVPSVSVEGENFEILGRFVKYVYTVKRYRDILGKNYSAEEWLDILNNLQQDLFSGTADNDGLQEINNGIRAFGTYTAGIISEELPAYVVAEFFKSYFKSVEKTGGYMEGGITFCSMIPMRSIPFKIICMIGMNDTSFPRIHKPVEFDLTAVYPAKGDRSTKDNDRYLFLETIMSARKKLYISYTGQSIKDNSDIPPSPVVAGLLEYVRQISGGGYSLINKHKLHPFSITYFDEKEKMFSYSKTNFQIAESYLETPVTDEDRGEDILTEDAKPPSEIDIEEIAYFFKNPLRYYFKNNLGIYPENLAQDNEDVEPLNLNNLQKTILKDRLAKESLFSEEQEISLDEMLNYYRKSGLFPPGKFGEYMKEVNKYNVSFFTNNIKKTLKPPEIKAMDFYLDVKNRNINIRGEYMLSGSVNILARMAKIKDSDRIKAWLYHIFALYDLLQSNRYSGEFSTLFYSEDKILKFEDYTDLYKNDEKMYENLHSYVRFIVETYIYGSVNPLPLFPVFGCSYAKKIIKGESADFGRSWWAQNVYKNDDKFYLEKLYGDVIPGTENLKELSRIIYLPMLQKESFVGT